MKLMRLTNRYVVNKFRQKLAIGPAGVAEFRRFGVYCPALAGRGATPIRVLPCCVVQALPFPVWSG
jgi:hypothetical protein